MIKRIFEKHHWLDAAFMVFVFLSLSALFIYGLIKANDSAALYIQSDKPIKPEIKFIVEDGKVVDTVYIYIKKRPIKFF